MLLRSMKGGKLKTHQGSDTVSLPPMAPWLSHQRYRLLWKLCPTSL